MAPFDAARRWGNLGARTAISMRHWQAWKRPCTCSRSLHGVALSRADQERFLSEIGSPSPPTPRRSLSPSAGPP